MDWNLFDSYNLRVRLCARAILVLPFVLDGIVLTSHVPSITESVVFAAILAALAQVILGLSCRQGKSRDNRSAAAELLAPGSALSDGTRRRYYRKLKKLEPDFAPLAVCVDPAASSAERAAVDVGTLCAEAVIWLRAKSRDGEAFHLVHEENINYGFACHMLRQQSAGLRLNLVMALIFGVCLAPQMTAPDWLTLKTAVLCLMFHSAFALYYIFGATETAVEAAAKRYAYALLEVIDILEP